MHEEAAQVSHGHGHVVPYGTFVKVWLALVGLTGLLVYLASLHMDNLGLWATLIITPFKAGLVLYYFMHLKYESSLLKLMVFIAFAALVIFLGLMMFDVLLR